MDGGGVERQEQTRVRERREEADGGVEEGSRDARGGTLRELEGGC